MADDFSGWTLQPATDTAPSEVAGWTLHPVQAPAAQPSTLDAVRRGATQGATLGFGDELVGALGTPFVRAVQAFRNHNAVKLTPQAEAEARAAGIQAPPAPPEEGWADTYRALRDADRAGNAAASKAHGKEYALAQLAGSIPTSFLPGLNVAAGSGLGATVARTAAAGGLAGLGGSNADLTRGDVGRAALDTGVGAGVGAVAGGLGYGLGRLAQGRYAKVAGIDEAVARKAAADAASETASARSAAGTAAQDTYKQLEHLRELGGKGLLNPEGQALAASLEQELAQKAAAKLPEAAARKAATSEAFKEAMSTEAQRAEKLAAEKLSGAEALRQLKARALRYGLPAAGGALAGAMGFGGHGALIGAGSGALMGAGLRPMMHSLIRMADQPAVARPLAQGVGAALRYAATPAATHSAGAASLALSPEIAAQIAALRKRPDDFANWTPQGDTQ